MGIEFLIEVKTGIGGGGTALTVVVTLVTTGGLTAGDSLTLMADIGGETYWCGVPWITIFGTDWELRTEIGVTWEGAVEIICTGCLGWVMFDEEDTVRVT